MALSVTTIARNRRLTTIDRVKSVAGVEVTKEPEPEAPAAGKGKADAKGDKKADAKGDKKANAKADKKADAKAKAKAKKKAEAHKRDSDSPKPSADREL